MNLDNPRGEQPVKAYARLLRELHGLIAAGKGDAEEADAIRDEMNEPWHAMTPQEQARMEGLSADLYAIAEATERKIVMDPAERRRFAESFSAAFANRNWDESLALLRRPPADVPPGNVAFMQARCWEHLGDLETALVYMKEAERHDPEIGANVLTYLLQLNRTEEGAHYVGRILDNKAASAEALYLAASALLASVRGLPIAETGTSVLEQVAAILERARPLASSRRRSGTLGWPETESFIVCMLGLCYERLGQMEKALDVYADFLKRYPDNPEVRGFRGIRLYESDRPSAIQDLETAIRASFPAVWPYYYLAHHAIERGEYSRCMTLCFQGMQKTARRDVLAQLNEWVGICRFMEDYPAKYTRQSFDEALALDPENQRIRRNRMTAIEWQGPPKQARLSLGVSNVSPDEASAEENRINISRLNPCPVVDERFSTLASTR
jgi:tetratricopeptide (TPR) repeat protein